MPMMPGRPSGGQGQPQAPFAPLPGGGPPPGGMPPSGPPGGPGGAMGAGHAFSPQMWAGSGVPNPQNVGKPPEQGGFTVQSLLPASLQPGAGHAAAQGPSAPKPQPNFLQGLFSQLGIRLPSAGGQPQSPFAAHSDGATR